MSTPAITVPDEADRATRADAEIRIHGSVGGIPGDLIDIEVCFMGVGKSPTRKLSRVSVPGQQGKVPVIKKTALADEQQSITERTG
ncbi:MAG: hypothetical protein GDA35_03605 [Hyphomonadaceae bacterium]|nr:hypothetical protein [Hyphomonadaceae bacterium]